METGEQPTLRRYRPEDLEAVWELHFEGLDAVGARMEALKKTGGRRAEIKRMRVRPGCWRWGYGQEMLSALERRAAGLGYSTLHLDTTIGQTAARRLYEKNGFREVDRARSGGFDCVFYEKDLCEKAGAVASR